MAVIRQAPADRIAQDAIVLDFGDLTRQGDQLRARAKADAQAVLAAAAAERQRLISTARDEGLAQGHAEGLERGVAEGRLQGAEKAHAERRDELEALLAGWSNALGDFERAKEKMLLEARQDVLRLAVMMGERVTRRTVQVDPHVAAAAMEATLALLARPTRATISVHPDDERVAREALPALLVRMGAHANDGSHVELRTDSALCRGSCITQSQGGGRIDASIPTQLDRMVAALLPGADVSPEAAVAATPVQDAAP